MTGRKARADRLCVLTVALALALAQYPAHWLQRQPNLPSGASYAFFEFAPTSGAGMPAACSTTAPTGAKGETITVTRTGSAYCSKQGPATTGIANGDLVLLSTDQPRISLVGALLAYLRESSRQNSILRSEELDNAAWTWENSGAAATTRTNDYATAPTGTQTAERLQIPATTGAQYSDTYQSFVVAAASGFSCSVFVRGTSTSGTTDLCGYDGAAWSCSDCSFASDSWSWCTKSWASGTGTSRFCKLGNNSNQNGGVARSANDALVWGFQGEAGAWPSSYIPTTSAAATRNADSAMTTTLSSAVGTSFSLGVSTAYLSSSVTTATAAQLGTVAPNLASVGRSSNTAAAFTINATSTTPAVSAQGTSMLRGCLSDAAGTRTAWWDGSTVSAPAASMSAGVTALSFGALDAYTARVLVDPSPTRCP